MLSFFYQNLQIKKRIIKELLHIIISRGRLWEIRKNQRHVAEKAVKVTKLIAAQKIVTNNFISEFDTFGAYTGTDSLDIYDKPVQDADDL